MFEIPLVSLDNINIINTAHVTGVRQYARDYEECIDLKLDEWRLVG